MLRLINVSRLLHQLFLGLAVVFPFEISARFVGYIAQFVKDAALIENTVSIHVSQGFSQATNRADGAVRRVEEALRKCTVAAAAGRNPASFAAYRLADSRLTDALPGRVHDQDLVANEQSELDDAEEQDEHEWQDEGQLHRCLAPVPPVPSHDLHLVVQGLT